MKNKDSLNGKVALVTGAAKRVGREIALVLAENGCHIVLHYHTSRKEALKTAAQIKKHGSQVILVKADVTKSDQVKKAVKSAVKAFGKIDILVNNAAVFKRTPFPNISELDWDRHIDTNLKGPFLFCKEVTPQMLRRKSGKIINLADWAAVRPYRHYLPYCVSKAGVISLTKALAKTLAPHIQVNAVAPGPVMLPPGTTKKDKKTIIDNVPLKKIGTPQDIAQAVLFLAKHSNFITGHTLTVDGGRLIA